MKRAAILIGIDKARRLRPLNAAVKGAESMRDWLQREGYNTTLLTDQSGDVTVTKVKDAVKDVVDSGQYEKLVIYFAGHGVMNGMAELWLLSDAVADPDETIDITRSVVFSRDCGIKNVIFVSDACRSLPGTVAFSRTTGATIFPTRNFANVDVDVDRFFAARPGDAAMELSDPPQTGEDDIAKYVGVFTEALVNIHVDPAEALVGSAEVDGVPSRVVLSRRLKRTLPELVNSRVQDRALSLRQQPQLRLECGDDGFVARAMVSKKPRRPTISPDDFHPLGRVDNIVDFRSSLSRTGIIVPDRDRDRFQSYRDKYQQIFSQSVDWKQTGVTIYGREVDSTWSQRFIERIERADTTSTILMKKNVGGPVSLVVKFVDGSGAVFAVVPGYHLLVSVEKNGITNIAYSPVSSSRFWDEYVRREPEVRQMRAEAAAAVNMGLFPTDRSQVVEFSNEVRLVKKMDPTLGLYAAMGYAEVGLKRELASVLSYMTSDLKGRLLDLVVLAGHERGFQVAPFSPLMRQTWAHLEKSSMRCPENIMKAGRYLEHSPWTTFTQEGMRYLENAAKEGKLEWQNH
ncbi:caspase family protein (plasmid) [Rhizobium leguminosarum]|jgi:hypothetical protein